MRLPVRLACCYVQRSHASHHQHSIQMRHPPHPRNQALPPARSSLRSRLLSPPTNSTLHSSHPLPVHSIKEPPLVRAQSRTSTAVCPAATCSRSQSMHDPAPPLKPHTPAHPHTPRLHSSPHSISAHQRMTLSATSHRSKQGSSQRQSKCLMPSCSGSCCAKGSMSWWRCQGARCVFVGVGVGVGVGMVVGSGVVKGVGVGWVGVSVCM